MKTINKLSDLDINGTYSYADYLTWKFVETVELIRGKIVAMSPAPSRRHQRISGYIEKQMYLFFERKPCAVYHAPFDVRLYNHKKSAKLNKDIFTVVQPDICIICDDSKLDDAGCNGAPDLIVEILSPGNSKKEVTSKFELYEESGVKEYWIVFPDVEILQQFVRNEATDKFEFVKNYASDQTVHSPIFPDFKMDLEKVFAE